MPAGKGYYRSAYPASVYAALVARVETTLTPAERISLIGDEWAQVRANKAPIGDYLDLVAAVKNDPDAEVVGEAIESSEHGLRAGCRHSLKKVTRSLPGFAQPLRPSTPGLASLRVRLGQHPRVARPSLRPARQLRQRSCRPCAGAADCQQVPGQSRLRRCHLGQTALAIAARNGDAALFDQLQKVAETSTNPEFQEGALRLLAEFEDPALVQRSLDYAASGKVRNQDAAIQFAIALQIRRNPRSGLEVHPEPLG